MKIFSINNFSDKIGFQKKIKSGYHDREKFCGMNEHEIKLITEMGEDSYLPEKKFNKLLEKINSHPETAALNCDFLIKLLERKDFSDAQIPNVIQTISGNPETARIQHEIAQELIEQKKIKAPPLVALLVQIDDNPQTAKIQADFIRIMMENDKLRNIHYPKYFYENCDSFIEDSIRIKPIIINEKAKEIIESSTASSKKMKRIPQDLYVRLFDTSPDSEIVGYKVSIIEKLYNTQKLTKHQLEKVNKVFSKKNSIAKAQHEAVKEMAGSQDFKFEELISTMQDVERIYRYNGI